MTSSAAADGDRRQRPTGGPTGGPTGEPRLVGVVLRAHGVRGEVIVEPRTDVPRRRFAVGRVLTREPAGAASPADPDLVVANVREHSGRLLVRFEGVDDRTGAEELRGVRLVIDADDAGPPADAGEDPDGLWWDSELIGLSARLSDGSAVGEVTGVVHGAGNDLLVVRSGEGRSVLIPFVAAVVPVVDTAAGRLVVDPPPGLLEL
jgi:16S rRNA processing protein RimM